MNVKMKIILFITLDWYAFLQHYFYVTALSITYLYYQCVSLALISARNLF
jgi:hypothetical protein